MVDVLLRPRYIAERSKYPARRGNWIQVSAQACCVAGLRDRAGDRTYTSYGPFSTYTRGARAHIPHRQGQRAPHLGVVVVVVVVV